MKLDDWQQKLLETDGDIVAVCGRQVGKSTVVAIKAAQYAVSNPKKTILIIASVERQARLLFDKTLNFLLDENKAMIKKGRDKPTLHQIKLTNGSVIYCLPTGLSGYGIRGYTIDLLIADEAAFIPEAVWTAVTPMLAITKGKLILLSTPFGRGGFFYEAYQSEHFHKFHISSEDCPRKDVNFLEREKKRMSKLQYAQEYLGEFVDELRQFFPTDLINKCMFKDLQFTYGDFYLGVDVARLGGDETVLYTLTRSDGKLYEVDLNVSEKALLTETYKTIKFLDRRYNYKRIYIDDGGLGVGVFDTLLDDDQTKRKVVAINNSARSLDNEQKQHKKLLKEDLYNNLLVQMEQGKVFLLDNPETVLSLKSIQYEYDDGKLKIFGNYSHIVEALVRAAWCLKDKSLNIWITSL